MNRCLRSIFVLGLIASAVLAAPSRATAQLDGNTYVSPSFGYRLSWDASWWVDDEGSIDGVDFLGLANGITYVEIAGTDYFAGRTRPCVSNVRANIVATGNSNVEVLLDANQQPIESYQDDRSFLALTFTHTLEDGFAMDVGTYIECRTVVPGDSVVQFAATTPIDAFFADQPAVEALIAQLVIPSPGESGPVVVAGQWRVSAVAVRRDSAFPDLGLAEKDGKEWLVVAADVTNWGGQDAVFPTGDLRASRVDGSKPARLAPASTAKVARALGTEPADPKAGVPIGVDQTTRVVLVFQVSASHPELALDVAGERLPLETPPGSPDGDLTETPGVVTPPLLSEVTVERVRDGSHIVVSDADGNSRTLALFGVETPVRTECFADEAAAWLIEQTGGSVWIETERPNDESDGVYVWRVQSDGSRRLINQELVAGGFGAAIGAEGRFTAWLDVTERDAKDKLAGLWATCSDFPNTDRPEPSPGSEWASAPSVAPDRSRSSQTGPRPLHEAAAGTEGTADGQKSADAPRTDCRDVGGAGLS